MRLLLGSILLAVALAAPVNIDESTSTTEEPTETTTESVETDYDWRKLLRREFFADAAIDDFFAKGLHLSKNVEKAYEWIEKFADEINLKKEKLEQAFKYVVVPEIANVDAEDRNIFPVYNRETYERFHDWAKKWNLDKAAELRYEDMVVGTEYEESTTTTEVPPTETTTQSAEDRTDYRAWFRRCGISDAVADDFYAKGLHLLARDDRRVKEWADQFKGLGDVREKKLREAFRGIPDSAVNDFPGSLETDLPYNQETFEHFQAWARKWNLEKVLELSYKDIVIGSEYENSTPTIEELTENTTPSETEEIENGKKELENNSF